MGTTRQRRDRKADGRKTWSKRRQPARDSRLLSNPQLSPERIATIREQPLRLLPGFIDLARGENNVELQEDVVRACLTRILSHNRAERIPRDEQVRTLRRLIFNRSDVLLIARTGFGKSIIFHAYSLLTRKITLQLVPLNKLGEEQLSDIRKLSGAKPCLLNEKTRTAERRLIERIEKGEFTHVLLGPEQASSRPFRRALKQADFQARIGLVAIDEVHLVMQWETFRPAFTMLGQLRTILHQDIVWFGCTATLDALAEDRVLKTAGFRRIGNRRNETTVIRTSVDRPDISISLVQIPRFKLTAWDTLYFLLRDAVNDSRATPQRIPKTIVFIDGRRKLQAAAVWMMETLVQMSTSFSSGGRYSDAASEDGLCVMDIVHVFTANVSDFDREATYNEFRKPTSRVRIVFATTTLGMGINIADVALVVTHHIPISRSLGDLWQRLGRGGRGEGQTSQAIVMLPYWLFDSAGQVRPPKMSGSAMLQSADAISSPDERRKPPRRLRVAQSYQPSQLSQCATPGDLSDIDDVVHSDFEVDDETIVAPDTDKPTLPYWNTSELAQREKMPPSWFDMVNCANVQPVCRRESTTMLSFCAVESRSRLVSTLSTPLSSRDNVSVGSTMKSRSRLYTVWAMREHPIASWVPEEGEKTTVGASERGLDGGISMGSDDAVGVDGVWVSNVGDITKEDD